MQKTKQHGIKEADFFQFVTLLNEFGSTHNVIATQTFHEGQHWYAVVYYKVEVVQ